MSKNVQSVALSHVSRHVMTYSKMDNGCQKPPLLTPFLAPVAPRRARDRVHNAHFRDKRCQKQRRPRATKFAALLSCQPFLHPSFRTRIVVAWPLRVSEIAA